MPPLISVVTPVYQAASCLAELHRRLTAVLGALGDSYEVVFVDDGCTDGSSEILERIAADDAHTVVIGLSRNFGQHAAILAGIAEACGERIVVMDCDLQDRPEDVPHLLAKLDEGFDVVVARREARTDGWLTRAASRLWFAVLDRFSDFPVEPGAASFSALRRTVAEAVLAMPNRHTHYQLVLRWVGFRRTCVTVADGGRFEGRSAYSWRRLVAHAVTGLVAHSTRLLHFSIYLGFSFVLVSIVQFAHVILDKLRRGISVAGWASLMGTIWLIGGAILFSLGVIGLYLGRMIDDVKQRPPYVIAKRVRRIP